MDENNFWDNCEDDIDGTFESGGFKLIPDGTNVVFTIENAEWIESDMNYPQERISITWNVEKPEYFAGTKIFQKIKVRDEKEKTANSAKKMFAAIDHNAGGKIRKAKKFPSDDVMAKVLIGKTMGGKMSVWEMNDASGNWVNKVYPENQYVDNYSKVKVSDKTSSFDDDEDSDIPF